MRLVIAQFVDDLFAAIMSEPWLFPSYTVIIRHNRRQPHNDKKRRKKMVFLFVFFAIIHFPLYMFWFRFHSTLNGRVIKAHLRPLLCLSLYVIVRTLRLHKQYHHRPHLKSLFSKHQTSLSLKLCASSSPKSPSHVHANYYTFCYFDRRYFRNPILTDFGMMTFFSLLSVDSAAVHFVFLLYFFLSSRASQI